MADTVDARLASIERKLDAILQRMAPPVHMPTHPPAAEEREDVDDDEGPPPSFDDGVDDGVGESASDMARLSREAFARADYAKAVQLADRGVQMNGDSASALRARGRAHLLLESWERARADLSAAQRIDFDEAVETDLKKACAQCQPTHDAKGGGGGAPHPPIDLGKMMADPAVMGNVANVLNNPDAMRALQNSDLFRSMLGGAVAPP